LFQGLNFQRTRIKILERQSPQVKQVQDDERVGITVTIAITPK
jgi:putative ubiquitin-RnfH superfamily antitoxin RatB of RatAB toxin-antitoxin module